MEGDPKSRIKGDPGCSIGICLFCGGCIAVFPSARDPHHLWKVAPYLSIGSAGMCELFRSWLRVPLCFGG